jgi:hypothetical protein
MSFPSDRYSDKLCAQRLANGDPCTSHALRDERFCHYHKIMGPSAINIDNNQLNSYTHVYLPQLGDAVSIQSAISEVCEMMLHRRIEPKEATALFYAMQVASTNLYFLNGYRNPTADSPRSSDPSPDPKRLPPGTIQACEHPRQRKRRLRSSPGVRSLESMP